jgi:transcriptional repressor NrdR
MIVTKKSGSKELYSREKLVSSIVRSCSKSQITAITIDSIVDQVEATMYQRYSREVPSSALGSMVMAELKIQDPMAYIRYASIFKKINSIGEFIDEMKNLEDSVLGIEFQPIG